MSTRIAILGGGHGLASVLRALRGEPAELTVVVTVADDGGSSGELRRRGAGPAVGDLRRCLVALADDEAALGRAFKRLVTVNRLGSHPLGNLMILSIARALGDLAEATGWLGDQLGIAGVVLPASAEPVSLVGEVGDELIHGESAIGSAGASIRRLGFIPERPEVPAAVLEAIEQADVILLAPGSLFTSVIATSALPDVAAALARTAARVVWIANLEPEELESAGMSAADHLAALRGHGIRVDAALHDPAAALHFAPGELEAAHVEPLPRELEGAARGTHDPALLRVALRELLAQAGGGAAAAGALAVSG